MMFRTEIKSPREVLSLRGDERILMMGSCFTDNIGGKLRDAQWKVCVNPCGVQYNPASISKLVRAAVESGLPEDTFFCSGGVWRNWMLPSQFAAQGKWDAVAKSAEAITVLREAIEHSDVMVLTFGTAWVYEHRKGGVSDYEGVVGNCHKVVAAEFDRRRLGVDEIVEEWNEVIRNIRCINPQVKIVFTVSPIRHIKDGLHGNSVSKSILMLAVDELCAQVEGAYYFPAFEIVNDDLRDYRFYAADMLHPSGVAIDYIWEQFQKMYMTEAARRMTEDGEKLHRRLSHRVIGDGSEAEAFAVGTEAARREFLDRYPWLKE